MGGKRAAGGVGGEVTDRALPPADVLEVKGLIFKWLNRCSQRKSFTWEKLLARWTTVWRLPPARVVEEIDPAYQPRLAL